MPACSISATSQYQLVTFNFSSSATSVRARLFLLLHKTSQLYYRMKVLCNTAPVRAACWRPFAHFPEHAWRCTRQRTILVTPRRHKSARNNCSSQQCEHEWAPAQRRHPGALAALPAQVEAGLCAGSACKSCACSVNLAGAAQVAGSLQVPDSLRHVKDELLHLIATTVKDKGIFGTKVCRSPPAVRS